MNGWRVPTDRAGTRYCSSPAPVAQQVALLVLLILLLYVLRRAAALKLSVDTLGGCFTLTNTAMIISCCLLLHSIQQYVALQKIIGNNSYDINTITNK